MSHFEMDSKAVRDRNSTQTGALSSQMSPRHYGNPLIVRVSGDETVAVNMFVIIRMSEYLFLI